MWFRRKDINKTTEITCQKSETCNVTDNNLNNLRENQAAQRVIKERINVLEKKYFPMVYWWIVVCYKVGDRMYFNPKHMCRGDIEDTLQKTIDVLRGSDSWFAREILEITDFSEFDVDQFCKEMKDYFTTETQIAELNQEYSKLIESEKNLKRILRID